jgi:serine/threonine-protein phosphatase 4 catalytic subunit
MSDIDSWIHQLKHGKILKETDVKILCTQAKEILQLEDNVINVEAPVTVEHKIDYRFVETFMDNFMTL